MNEKAKARFCQAVFKIFGEELWPMALEARSATT